jgi:hypothetical protein
MIVIVDLSDLQKIMQKNWNPAQIGPLLNAVILVAGIDARSMAVPQTPVSDGWMFKDGKIGKKTGGYLRSTLQGGADSIWQVDNSKHELHFGTKVKYAGAVICEDDKSHGNPFVIKAKNKPFLVFPISRTQVVRTKQVTHPGAKKLTGLGSGKALFTRVADFVESNAEKYVKGVAQKFPLLMR